MARLTNRYFTPYEMLVSFLTKSGVTPIASLDKWLYPFEAGLFQHRSAYARRHVSCASFAPAYNDYTHLLSILLGGFNPIVSAKKAVSDSFKPYRSPTQFHRDLLQPIRGVGNLIRSLLNCLVIPLPLIFIALSDALNIILTAISLAVVVVTLPCHIRNILRDASKRASHNRECNNIKMLLSDIFQMHCFFLARAIAQCVDTILSLPLGLMQVLTTPITYLFVIPFRVWLTPKHQDGEWIYPEVADNPSIQVFANNLFRSGDKTLTLYMAPHDSTGHNTGGTSYVQQSHPLTPSEKNFIRSRRKVFVCKIQRAIAKGQPAGRLAKFVDIQLQIDGDIPRMTPSIVPSN